MHLKLQFLAGVHTAVAALVMAACGPGSGDDEASTTKDDTSGGATSGATGTSEETTETPTSAGPTTDGTSAGPTTVGPTEGTSEATTADETGPQVCTAPPLTEEQVSALGFGVFGNEFEAQPGDQRMLKLGVIECCYFVEEVDACVEYSLTPSEGASYDPASGLLTIEDSVEAGTVYTLTADVEDGRAQVAAKITVYTPESDPLVGVWREVAQTPCSPGPTIDPEQAIGELWFKANGEVLVTWQPFEIYVDYWGTYTFDLATGQLQIAVDGGNYVPPDVDGEGGFLVEGGELRLADMWLGTPQNGAAEPACGHRFER